MLLELRHHGGTSGPAADWDCGGGVPIPIRPQRIQTGRCGDHHEHGATTPMTRLWRSRSKGNATAAAAIAAMRAATTRNALIDYLRSAAGPSSSGMRERWRTTR